MRTRDASFDAGEAGVPQGVTGEVERVVVVGAGIAGLTTANALAHAGIRCVVLEARERLGGRLHTADLGGSPVDLGGSWIHHPVGNPLRAFAGLSGVACRPGDPLPKLGAVDLAEGRRLSRLELDEILALERDAFPAALPRLREQLGPAASAADGIDALIAGAGLAAAPARRARQELCAAVEADGADACDRHSLRWLWHELEYGGDLF
jgi:polyamine oxidase